jgi:hypothetical protein
VPDLTQLPLAIDTEWLSKTVTTDPPRYTPHLEWTLRFALAATDPLRAVVFIQTPAEVTWGLMATDPANTPWLEVKFFPYDWAKSDDVQISFEWQRVAVTDRKLKEDPRTAATVVAPKEATTGVVVPVVELPNHVLTLSLLALAEQDTENRREGRWRLKPALAHSLPSYGDALASGHQSGATHP